MSSPVNPSMKSTLHSIRNTLLATIIVVTQLVACGGGGGSDVIESSSTESSVTDSSSVPDSSVVGSFSLSWTAPTTRSDGNPLSLADIDGFRIYYGETEGYYPNRADVVDGSAQSAVVENVPVGSYYVVMTTYDVNGLESGYSSAISKTVF
jgi:hypothetical protein